MSQRVMHMPLSFNKRTTSFVVLPWFVTTDLCDAIVETILEPISLFWMIANLLTTYIPYWL